MKYDIDKYNIHEKHITELLKECEEWSDYVSSSVKYDFTRFNMYFNGASKPEHLVMTVRGSKLTIAEARSRLLRLFKAIDELQKEFEDEVNYAE